MAAFDLNCFEARMFSGTRILYLKISSTHTQCRDPSTARRRQQIMEESVQFVYFTMLGNGDW